MFHFDLVTVHKLGLGLCLAVLFGVIALAAHAQRSGSPLPSVQSNPIEPSDDPARPVIDRSLVDAVVDVCRRYPLVLMGERHGLVEQHEFIFALLDDKAFQDRVDVLFYEVGNAKYQGLIDAYVAGRDVPTDQLKRVWQDMCTSPFTAIESGIYARFYEKVRRVNLTLPDENRFRVVAGDPPFDWESLEQTPLQTFIDKRNQALADRDRHYYEKNNHLVFQEGKVGFAIVGRSHLLPPEQGQSPRSLGGLLRVNHADDVFVIAPTYRMAGNARKNADLFTPRESGLIMRITRQDQPALLRLPADGLAALDGSALLGEDMSMDPAGRVRVGGAGVPLGRIVDALLHLGPDDRLTLEQPVFSPAYRAELQRRRRVFIEAGQQGIGGFQIKE